MNLKFNYKILLQLAGVLLVVASILAFNSVLAGIGIGIAGMLIFGPDVEQKSGKTGGLVYVLGKTGPYTRARVKGRNPRSDAQMANRQTHRNIMKQWKLPIVNQVAWNKYAASHPVPNRMGRMTHISGINWFLKYNRMAKKANPGCPLLTEPPKADTNIPVIKNVIPVAAASPESLVVSALREGNYLPGMKVEVSASICLSYGVSRAFRFCSIGIYEPADSLDVTADYLRRYKELIKGTKVFVKLRIIAPSGETIPFIISSAVVH